MVKLQMSEAVDRKYFVGFLGVIALVADIVTIAQFINSSGFLGFWSFHWIISIIFIVGLFSFGLFLLSIADLSSSAEIVMLVFGIAYLSMALILYIFWGYTHVHNPLDFGEYTGFGLLFIISTGVALIVIDNFYKKYLRFPSYAFGIVNTLYLFLLIKKYVFNHANFDFNHFIGEMLLLIIGAFLFLGLFFESE